MATTSPECVNLIPVTNRVFPYEGLTKQGKRRSFLVGAFIGDKYRTNLLTLRHIAIHLDQKVFGIPFDQASEEVHQNMRLESGSMLLASVPESEVRGSEKLKAMSWGRSALAIGRILMEVPEQTSEPEPECIGYSSQQLWLLPMERKQIKVLYISTMAILEDYRRMGLGAYFLSIANALYQPDIITFRTRSGAAIAALRKSTLVNGQPIYPLERYYDEDTIMGAVLKLADRKTVHRNPIDLKTGLTKAVYLEGSDYAYKPDGRPGTIAFDADQRMRELKLNPDEGDGIYVAGRVIGRNRLPSLVELTGLR